MDMARKFLQMGHTRARRYVNRRSGRKYERRCGEGGGTNSGKVREQDEGALEGAKAQTARIFYEEYVLARDDAYYDTRRREGTEKEKAGQNPTA